METRSEVLASTSKSTHSSEYSLPAVPGESEMKDMDAPAPDVRPRLGRMSTEAELLERDARAEVNCRHGRQEMGAVGGAVLNTPRQNEKVAKTVPGLWQNRSSSLMWMRIGLCLHLECEDEGPTHRESNAADLGFVLTVVVHEASRGLIIDLTL
jgi:hypothetical protein